MSELNKLMNEINWLVSILIAIPLAVTANLLTPRMQNWRAGKTSQSAKARLLVLERELVQTGSYAADQSKLNSYLAISLIVVILLFAFTSIVMGLLGTLIFSPVPRDFVVFIGILAPVTSMLTALFNVMAVVRAFQAITVYRRVENFAEYEAFTRGVIEKLRARST